MPDTTRLKLSQITLDGALQARVKLTEATVAEYAESYAAGKPLDPLVVFFDGEKYWLADGWHRHRAATRAFVMHHECDVRQGSRRDALRYATGANAKHGLQRTADDKRKAVRLHLQEFGDESDRAIAEHVRVSPTLVGQVRKEMEARGKGPAQMALPATGDPQTEVTTPAPRPRRAKDGRVINTAKIGKRSKHGPSEEVPRRENQEQQGQPDPRGPGGETQAGGGRETSGARGAAPAGERDRAPDHRPPPPDGPGACDRVAGADCGPGHRPNAEVDHGRGMHDLPAVQWDGQDQPAAAPAGDPGLAAGERSGDSGGDPSGPAPGPAVVHVDQQPPEGPAAPGAGHADEAREAVGVRGAEGLTPEQRIAVLDGQVDAMVGYLERALSRILPAQEEHALIEAAINVVAGKGRGGVMGHGSLALDLLRGEARALGQADRGGQRKNAPDLLKALGIWPDIIDAYGEAQGDEEAPAEPLSTVDSQPRTDLDDAAAKVGRDHARNGRRALRKGEHTALLRAIERKVKSPVGDVPAAEVERLHAIYMQAWR